MSAQEMTTNDLFESLALFMPATCCGALPIADDAVFVGKMDRKTAKKYQQMGCEEVDFRPIYRLHETGAVVLPAIGLSFKDGSEWWTGACIDPGEELGEEVLERLATMDEFHLLIHNNKTGKALFPITVESNDSIKAEFARVFSLAKNHNASVPNLDFESARNAVVDEWWEIEDEAGGIFWRDAR